MLDDLDYDDSDSPAIAIAAAGTTWQDVQDHVKIAHTAAGRAGRRRRRLRRRLLGQHPDGRGRRSRARSPGRGRRVPRCPAGARRGVTGRAAAASPVAGGAGWRSWPGPGGAAAPRSSTGRPVPETVAGRRPRGQRPAGRQRQLQDAGRDGVGVLPPQEVAHAVGDEGMAEPARALQHVRVRADNDTGPGGGQPRRQRPLVGIGAGLALGAPVHEHDDGPGQPPGRAHRGQGGAHVDRVGLAGPGPRRNPRMTPAPRPARRR